MAEKKGDCPTCEKVDPGTYNVQDLTPGQVQTLENMGLPEGYGQVSPQDLESMGLNPQFCNVIVTQDGGLIYNGDAACYPAESAPCC